MATIPFDVDQAGWGSTQRYPDTDSFNPAYVVAHWGGGTSQIPAAGEDDRLRIWQRYHVQSRGMRDIAYNYAVGDSGLSKDRTVEGVCLTDLAQETVQRLELFSLDLVAIGRGGGAHGCVSLGSAC